MTAITFPNDDNSESAIPNWKTKIGKVVCEDKDLSMHFPKSSRDAGFLFDEERKYAIGAKLRVLGSSPNCVNQELENGDIKVACSKNQSFSELDDIMKETQVNNVWIAVQGIPDGNKYLFKGYYKYVKREGSKYLIRPLHASTPSSSVYSEDEDEEVFKSKRHRSNNYIRKYEPTIQSVRPFYNGIRYDSKTEARYGVFLNFFQIPYVCQVETGILNGNQNYSQYVIDYEVYPKEEEKRFFLEVKPFRPSLQEEELCERVAYTKNVPVYLMYGNFDVPFSLGQDFPNGYTGIRFCFLNGKMTREEGFVFTERNGEICIDRRYSSSDFGFYSLKLKQAYEHVKEFGFSY